MTRVYSYVTYVAKYVALIINFDATWGTLEYFRETGQDIDKIWIFWIVVKKLHCMIMCIYSMQGLHIN